jgi:hypothetical protein
MSSTGIEIYDDFLSSDLQNFVWEYCIESSYTYGEYDTPETPPTGMVHEIEGNDIYKLFYEKTKDLVPKNFNLYRMYVNCFAPSECPYFHTDGEGITFLYYPQHTWDIDMGGETQFVIDDEIKGIFPIPNRLVMFDGNILHRATTFRSRHRFTLAIKYGL